MPGTATEPELLLHLRENLIFRRIESGLKILEARRNELEALNPEQPDAAILVGFLAQWADAGFAEPALIRNLIDRFPKKSRSNLPLIAYLHLRMAEGLVAMLDEDFGQAIRHFSVAESLEEETSGTELLSLSKFWIGRCLRHEGRYDDALSYTIQARQLACDSGYVEIAAVIQVLEGWLAFQKGRLKEARRALYEAERVLNSTSDYVSRGNIQSAYGRIARREGKYERALEHFERALELYRMRDERHKNYARSLVNISIVKRIIAAQLHLTLDRQAARRKAGAENEPTLPGMQERTRIEQLRREAFAELDGAFRIYSHHRNRRGMGAVHINRAFLHLDTGELDRASLEAAEAFRLAEDKSDYIPMARARILQCMIENAKYEEQIEEPPGPNRHAQLADEFARDAVQFATHTQNARLLARAYVWQGLTFSNEFFDNIEAARRCCDAALGLLKPGVPEPEWNDLRELRGRVLKKGQIDVVLQEWSEGLVGGKTFQQISDEFAGIVIPKVWEREGRKVARVAAKLSISPKKVRRILQTAGLLDKR